MRRIVSCLLPLLLWSSMWAADLKISDGSFRTSDNVQLHYLEVGRGPSIVFIPGWTLPAWIWEPQLKHFAQHYHVVALDPRSQGKSAKVLFGNCPERRAQDIKELVDHLKLKSPVLVGWSLAVSELLNYAERFGGENVGAYVLVDGFTWEKPNLQYLNSTAGMYREIQANRREFTEKFVRGMYRKAQPDEYIQRLVATSLEMPADSAIAASVSSVARADWRPAIQKMDRPILVACQAVMKPRAADLIQAAHPSARVELFGEAGHALFVDEPEKFNQVLDDFLAHPPQAAPETQH